MEDCPHCKGTGVILIEQRVVLCFMCHGTGKQQEEPEDKKDNLWDLFVTD